MFPEDSFSTGCVFLVDKMQIDQYSGLADGKDVAKNAVAADLSRVMYGSMVKAVQRSQSEQCESRFV